MTMSFRISVLICLAGIAFAQPAFSADRAQSQSMTPRIQLAMSEVQQGDYKKIADVMTVRTVDPACFCWANGERFNRGESACLRTGNGRVLAQCDQVTNVMSWSFTQNPCPES